jgi:hypothetical protein
MTDHLIVGIDTGVNTGYAVWNKSAKQFSDILTLQIHEVILRLNQLHQSHRIKVRIEDARLRKWVSGGREKLQGVGSVKRDAKILEDFCKDKGITYELVAPKNNKTKLTPDVFVRMTGWRGKCSEHARDAAMLVFNMS